MARELTDARPGAESAPCDKCVPRGLPQAYTLSDEEALRNTIRRRFECLGAALPGRMPLGDA